MKQDKDYELPAPGSLQVLQPVELEVISETDLGYKAVVDDRYIGIIYRSEISQPLQIGQYLKGWIKGLRPDGKIDLTITKLDSESREELEDDILAYLNRKGGTAQLSDKTSPEEIYKLFKTSKKNFKRAIGRLYKNREIIIRTAEICLTDKAAEPASPWKKALASRQPE
jgi:predicted RNA-binding protein (virulence factor B family)